MQTYQTGDSLIFKVPEREISLQPVIEAGQLETVDVAARPLVGGRIAFIPTPGHSPDHAALILSSGDDYACFSGDLLHSPRQFTHPHWSSAFCGDPRQAERSRREMMAWCASHHAQWFTGHFAGPSCGWLEEDRPEEYRWRDAGQRSADEGER